MRCRVLPLAAVLELLAPVRCLACRRRGTDGDEVWCRRCRRAIVPAPRSACRRCGGPARAGHGCWPPDAPIASTLVADDYRGPIAAAVVAAKVGGATAAWPTLGERLAGRVAAAPPPVDVVTWIATSPRRARQRGIDHAAALADVVADRLGVPAVPLLAWCQHRDGTERQRARRSLPGTAVLLVDDVLTTGVTASGAAAALRDAGCGEVHLAVLARAGDHPLEVATPAAARARRR